jgi:hypothetical protein
MTGDGCHPPFQEAEKKPSEGAALFDPQSVTMQKDQDRSVCLPALGSEEPEPYQTFLFDRS